MLNLEKRIAALESSASHTGLKIIVVEDNETQAAAMVRLGLPPDARVVYLTPLDARL